MNFSEFTEFSDKNIVAIKMIIRTCNQPLTSQSVKMKVLLHLAETLLCDIILKSTGEALSNFALKSKCAWDTISIDVRQNTLIARKYFKDSMSYLVKWAIVWRIQSYNCIELLIRLCCTLHDVNFICIMIMKAQCAIPCNSPWYSSKCPQLYSWPFL